MCPGVEVALERQDLSRTYLAHRELEKHFVVVIIIIVVVVVVVVIVIIVIIIIKKADCVQVLMRQRELGLQQLAGTADMAIDGPPSPFTAGPGSRGTITPELTCITYPTCSYNNRNVILWCCSAAVAIGQSTWSTVSLCKSLAFGTYLTVPMYHCAYVPLCPCTPASVPNVRLNHNAVCHTRSKRPCSEPVTSL